MLSQGISQGSISSQVHCSKRTVSLVSKTLADMGKTASELLVLPDPELEAIFSGAKKSRVDEERRDELERLMPEVNRRLSGRHATVQYVYETYYIRECPEGYGYTQFAKYVKEWNRRNNVSYHNVHEPGKEWQIDWAGDPLWLTDRLTGERKRLDVLVCVMPYSNLPWMMALPEAKTEWFFHGLNKGLEFMGALPAVAKSDNMKQWVTKTDRYDLAFSEANVEWATYYGIEPTACRVRRPRDKGPVESAVNQLYNYVYARMENEVFHDLDAVNARILELLTEYVELPYKGRSRWRIFTEEELPQMRPLPQKMFRTRRRKEVKLGSSYHVCVGAERHFYSVPYRYVGRQVKVMWDAESVEVYAGNELLCIHARSTVPYGYSTEKAHMPEKHKAYERSAQMNAASLIEWGQRIGPSVGTAIENILERTTFPQQAYRTCQGLLSLGKKYGYRRLDRACDMLIGTTGCVSHKSVSNILKNNRDMIQDRASGAISSTPSHSNIRGAAAYCSIPLKTGKEGDDGI